MPFFPLFTATVFLVLSAVSGFRTVIWYHPVAGNCSDLSQVKNYSALEIASGFWYYQYTSFGHKGDRCSSGHALQRGNKTYVDLMMFDPSLNYYISFPIDVTYHKNQGGMYTDALGAVGHMIATDLVNYFYYVQCRRDNGQTKVMAVFSTRGPSVNALSQQVYQQYSARLKQKNLLPPMYQVPHVNCPPAYHVAPASTGMPLNF